MDIYPQDLGSHYEAKVLHLRGCPGDGDSAREAKTDNDGFWIGMSVVALLALGALLHRSLTAVGIVLLTVVVVICCLENIRR
ncbi:MAG: hypothetical protein M3Y13_02705, partial [Armatimonadota bacterium]|nr:hypothetical protein [Armatimonadota bacterium]